MKAFEVGKRYGVAGGGSITITKRTKCFVTFEGDFSGRKSFFAFGDKGLFGLGEAMWLTKTVPGKYEGTTYKMQVLCTAGYEE